MLFEEFKKHNDEMLALVPQDYALATHKRRLLFFKGLPDLRLRYEYPIKYYNRMDDSYIEMQFIDKLLRADSVFG